MKKLLFVALMLPVMMGACQQKNTSATEPSDPVAAAAANNTYATSDDEDNTIVEEDLSGKVISLTAREFKERILEMNDTQGYRYKGQTPCVVDFYANWCRPCMNFKPTFHKLSEQYKGKMIFYQVDVDKAQEICALFGIQSVPTFIFFGKDIQPIKMVGAPSEQEMIKAVEDF